jgi:hypothetical protein
VQIPPESPCIYIYIYIYISIRSINTPNHAVKQCAGHFCSLLTKFVFSGQILMQVLSIKFRENLSTESVIDSVIAVVTVTATATESVTDTVLLLLLLLRA